MEVFVFGLVLFSSLIRSSAALCFEFKGDWWLEYDDNINITDRAHYKFSLKTTQSFGNLFFARGPRYDFERLYLEDGVLNYFLFNPTQFGNGGTFGIHVQGLGMGLYGPGTRLSVADGQWHTVEFFRNTRLPGMNETSTGIIVDGHRNLDTRPRKDVIIQPPIFIGGSRDHEMFDGVLRDFEEVRNNFRFYETAQTVSIKRYVEPPYC